MMTTKTVPKIMKLRSLNHSTRKLRGGDWLVSKQSHMTLAVAWNGHNGKKYGLTVAHSFAEHGRTVGDSVFAFNSDEEEIPTPDGGKAHRVIKVGTVVSIDMATDSIIFEISTDIKIDPLAVALSGGDDQVRKIVLPKPGALSDEPLPYGKKLVMFGAARRGMIGCRVRSYDDQLVDVEKTDISAMFAAQSYDTRSDDCALDINGKTYAGDCGALYLDKDGNPWCMHTSIQGVPPENPTVWTSRGVMLRDIVNSVAHRFYFGYTPPISGASSSSSSSHENQASPADIKLTKISGPMMDQYPRIFFPEDQDAPGRGTIRFQPGLPLHRIPVVFPESDDDEIMAMASAREESAGGGKKRED